MKNKLILLFFTILFFFDFNGFSQDVHLSQFFNSDHYLNPSKIGDHDGDYRITGNYRSQWKQVNGNPLTTGMIAFDKSFRYFTHEIDAGVFVVRDQFAGFQTNVSEFYLSGAYTYHIKGYKLRAGIQTGMVSRSTNLQEQTFPNQWDYYSGTFDKGIYNHETNMNPSQAFWDLNLGFKSEKRFGKYVTHFGIAFMHLNRPKDTYFNKTDDRLRIRKNFNFDIDIPLNTRLTLSPKICWSFAAKANEFLFGSNLNFKTNHKVIPKIYAGVYYRHGVSRTFDAIYPIVGFSYKQIDFGLNYDVNLSALSYHVKRLGAFEFSVIYTAKSKKVKYKIVPCKRM